MMYYCSVCKSELALFFVIIKFILEKWTITIVNWSDSRTCAMIAASGTGACAHKPCVHTTQRANTYQEK